MPSFEIPADVQRFIHANIDTVPQLEAVLLLWATTPEVWSCDALAQRLYIRSEACAEMLAVLERRRLIARCADEPLSFRYDSAWDESGRLMHEVAAAYKRQLVPITTYIHSKGPSAVRDFARAFDLKKDR